MQERFEITDLTVNNAPVPTEHHTLYWCKIFTIPKRARKTQLIGVR